MVVVTTNTLARHRPLPDPLFLARKLVLLLLVGYVICYTGVLEALLMTHQTGLLRGSVKVKEA
jgi:cell division protein FtsL